MLTSLGLPFQPQKHENGFRTLGSEDETEETLHECFSVSHKTFSRLSTKDIVAT